MIIKKIFFFDIIIILNKKNKNIKKTIKSLILSGFKITFIIKNKKLKNYIYKIFKKNIYKKNNFFLNYNIIKIIKNKNKIIGILIFNNYKKYFYIIKTNIIILQNIKINIFFYNY